MYSVAFRNLQEYVREKGGGEGGRGVRRTLEGEGGEGRYYERGNGESWRGGWREGRGK